MPNNTIPSMIASSERARDSAISRRQAYERTISDIRKLCVRENRDPSAAEEAQIREALIGVDEQGEKTREAEANLRKWRAEQEQDDEYLRRSRETHPTGVSLRGADATVQVGDRPGARAGSSAQWVRSNDGERAVVGREERFADHPVVTNHLSRNSQTEAAMVGHHGGIGNLVRAVTTSSGSAIVPTVLVGDIIDRARNLSAVLRAGAEIIPMEAGVVKIGRLTGDPTAAFRAEGSTITASDPTFDNVTLTATTMSALVIGSMEWFQDADNVDEVVGNAIAQAFATQLDLAALYGSITSGAGSINLPTPSNPRGVLGTLNAVATSSVLGGVANGTTQTAASYYNELIDLIFTPRDFNEEPNALIYNAKLGRQYAKAYDTTGQPLQAPADVAALDKFVTNQVPSYTQGTMTSRATDAFVGDWTQLLIGQRLDFTLQKLDQRYAETGQIGIAAHWRGDIGIARPRAFAVYKALQGAA